MTGKLNLGLAFIMIAGLFVARGISQTDGRGKSYTLHGTVEGINDFAHSIRVNKEKIAGSSSHRIAPATADDAEMLKKLGVGDQIVATIYGRTTLYTTSALFKLMTP